MKEHPIIFSAESVRAILDGRKTQTRRVMKPQPQFNGWWSQAIGDFICIVDEYPPSAVIWHGAWLGQDAGEEFCCPYGVPGDRLWVREAHAIVPSSAYRLSRDDDGNLIPHRVSDDGYYWCVYREGWSRSRPSRWSPSIHMPRWASRLTLEVVSVRVERVQEISEKDAIAESPLYTEDAENLGADVPIAVSMFAHTWDAINGKKPGRSWKDNPWVWVIEFRRVE